MSRIFEDWADTPDKLSKEARSIYNGRVSLSSLFHMNYRLMALDLPKYLSEFKIWRATWSEHPYDDPDKSPNFEYCRRFDTFSDFIDFYKSEYYENQLLLSDVYNSYGYGKSISETADTNW